VPRRSRRQFSRLSFAAGPVDPCTIRVARKPYNLANPSMRPTHLAVLVFLSISSLHHLQGRADEPISLYTKTRSLPPLRVTYEQLQSVLDKTAALISAANASSPEIRFLERVRLKHEDLVINIGGRQLRGSGAKVPPFATEFQYTISANRSIAAPVASISMIFSDNDRNITVEGRSAHQVDALFASIVSDFTAMSSPIGGFTFRYFGGMVVLMVCGVVVFYATTNWLATRDRGLIAPVLNSFLVIGLTVSLRFSEFLAGFSVSAFDPAFASRYASEISAIGLLLTVVGIPLSYLLPKWFAQTSKAIQAPADTAPGASQKGARRKRHPR
jgi:hypothetical protein